MHIWEVAKLRYNAPRLLTVLLIILLLAPQASAAVTIEVNAGLEGYYKPGRWMPVVVTVDNERTEPFDGLLELALDENAGRSVYTKQVQLQAGSKESFTLNVLPWEYHTRITPVLLDGGGAKIAAARVKITPLDPQDSLIVVLGNRSAAALPEIPQYFSGTTYVAYVDGDALPSTWLGYDAADRVFLDEGVETLGSERKNALSGWLTSGGSALVNVKECPPERQGFIDALLPVELNATVEVAALPELEETYGPLGGNALICASTIKKGKALMATNRIPLVVKGGYGRGTIVFMAFDYAAPPFREWPGMSDLLRDVLAMGGEVRTESDTGFEIDNTMWGVLRELPALDVPAFKYLFLFLLLYIIAIGPLNYFILKKRKMLDYAWLTIPLIIGAFTIGAYAIGYGIKGGDLIVTETGIIEGSSSSPLLVTSTYFGIFSPKKTAYDVDMAVSGKLYSLLPSYRPDYAQKRGSIDLLITDEGSTIKDLDMYMWSFKSFAVKTVEASEKPLNVDLSVGGENVTGTVRSRLPYPITDVYVAYNRNARSLGTIKPGTEAWFTLPLEESKVMGLPNSIDYAAYPVKGGISDIERYKRDALLNRMTNIIIEEGRREPLLIGLVNWTTGIDVANETEVMNSQYIFLYRMPLFMPSRGNVSIDWSSAEKRVAEAHYTETMRVNPDGGVEIDEGSYIMVLELPVVLTGKEKVDVKKAELRIPPPAPLPSSQINLGIYNWRKKEWESLAAFNYQGPSAREERVVPPRPPEERMITLEEPEDYIMFPAGIVKIKVDVARGEPEETMVPRSLVIYVPSPDIKAELSITGDSGD